MYLREPYGNSAISLHITHSRKQHLLTSDSLYDFSTFKRKRLVILDPKTASHYQSLTSHYQGPNSTTSHSRTMMYMYGCTSRCYNLVIYHTVNTVPTRTF
jgi:hypothetical protein